MGDLACLYFSLLFYPYTFQGIMFTPVVTPDDRTGRVEASVIDSNVPLSSEAEVIWEAIVQRHRRRKQAMQTRDVHVGEK